MYASVQPGAFDPATEDIRLLLTDAPLTDEARERPFTMIRMARARTLHAVEIILGPTGDPSSGSLYFPEFDGMASASGMHRFERAVLERGRVAGRVFMDGPRTFAGVTYRYDATFSVAIPRPPTAEETAAAIASPAGLAASAHVRAIHESPAAFIATLTPQSAARVKTAGGAERFVQFRDETPRDSRVVALTSPDDNTRLATVQGTRDGIIIEFFVRLTRVGRDWLVEWP